MHMRDVHPFCPRLSPLADCAFPSRQRTSDLTIARGRRFCADTAVRRRAAGLCLDRSQRIARALLSGLDRRPNLRRLLAGAGPVGLAGGSQDS